MTHTPQGCEFQEEYSDGLCDGPRQAEPQSQVWIAPLWVQALCAWRHLHPAFAPPPPPPLTFFIQLVWWFTWPSLSPFWVQCMTNRGSCLPKHNGHFLVFVWQGYFRICSIGEPDTIFDCKSRLLSAAFWSAWHLPCALTSRFQEEAESQPIRLWKKILSGAVDRVKGTGVEWRLRHLEGDGREKPL